MRWGERWGDKESCEEIKRTKKMREKKEKNAREKMGRQGEL
jgi:hypothetical protein